MRAALDAQSARGGAGVRILTESVCSPTLAAQIRQVLATFPKARWHQWDPASRQNAYAGAKLAFGEYADVQHKVDRANVILSLDADFLCSGPGCLRAAREFAARRRPEDASRMNRLYVIESMPTSTGARADHRLACKPSDIPAAARSIAAAIGVPGVPSVPPVPPALAKWVGAVAKDLQAHPGASLIVAGDSQPPAVHVLAHAMNEALGNAGTTVVYTAPVEAAPIDQLQSLRDLSSDMSAGIVDLLLILGGNPVYTAPADIAFSQAMDSVPLRVHLSLYEDETSALCHWQIPEAHFLEAWSDARGHDGTVSIVQPLIAPLYGGKSAHEVVATMTDNPERAGHDVVREYWSRASGSRAGAPAFESSWRRWLHDGVIANSAYAPRALTVSSAASRLLSPPHRGRQLRQPAARSTSRSAPIRASSTGASRTTAGCRSCLNRSRSSRGTTR